METPKTAGSAAKANSSGLKRGKRRFGAAADGPGVQFVDWVRAHGVPACLLLALLCCVAGGLLFWFITFSDFSASADFVYNQF